MPCLGVDTGASFRWMELFQGGDRVVMGRDWGGASPLALPTRTRQLANINQGPDE